MQDLNASLRPLSDPASQPTLLCCFLTVAMPKSSKADPPVLLLSPAELAHKQAGHAEPSSGISLRKSTTTGTPFRSCSVIRRRLHPSLQRGQCLSECWQTPPELGLSGLKHEVVRHRQLLRVLKSPSYTFLPSPNIKHPPLFQFLFDFFPNYHTIPSNTEPDSRSSILDQVDRHQ
ncbi:predicted protein [Chaetomium globosum CBS 148.51]|uniref:Uncharacterized protein n=1 Tax=Chaetomium globosum (strain ATCC 6205 / CBS 148.51 / DSM 1962 / NBRC 6347 / NRRL 1970) TaxID=306901 RepID=Q2H445_CHAGB|nr:uncharacterized protein CHGG_06570 [Chaetomium globosum CBS 148.51]EAQ89951.1 predicted protein [Chaetomium globosum CBS 148.51]